MYILKNKMDRTKKFTTAIPCPGTARHTYQQLNSPSAIRIPEGNTRISFSTHINYPKQRLPLRDRNIRQR
ncbi:hypothetical protein DN748_02950 [Sinomicrobium soli]|nr:hypothetical protein DN748_02950 [Sinomicrobium sp. N-1-3-6]